MPPSPRRCFQCLQCGKDFVSSSKLSRHRREVHNNKDRFSCKLCGKKFSRSENYSKHISNPNVHNVCPVCNRADFSNRKELAEHLREDHGESRRVTTENEQFKSARLSSNKNAFSDQTLTELPLQDDVIPDETVLSEYPSDYRELIREHWVWIKTRYVKRSVMSTFNLRFPQGQLNVDEIGEFLRTIHQVHTESYKLQLQFGYVYKIIKSYKESDFYYQNDHEEQEEDEDEETSEPLYFIPQRPSATNPGFIPEPWTVARSEHLEDLIRRLKDSDILEHLNLRRPSTKYIVELVTNVMVYVYNLNKAAIGCCQETVPKYLTEKQSVMTLFYRNGRKDLWPDSRCLFRCMAAQQLLTENPDSNALSMSELESKSDELFHRYCISNSLHPDKFTGAISLGELDSVENTFGVRIFVYELVPKMEFQQPNWQNSASADNLTASLLRKPEISAGMNLYLDLCHRHFSLIRNIEVYSSTFICGKNDCSRLFSSCRLCMQHQERCSLRHRKVRCSGGGYEPSPNLFEELESIGIRVLNAHRYQDFFATYDCEAYTVSVPESQRMHGNKTAYEGELILASISVCSSVDGFLSPKFFLSKGDPQQLVDEVVDYLILIGQKMKLLCTEKYSTVLSELEMKIENEWDGKLKTQLDAVQKKFLLRMEQLPVFGWNSRGFDLPLLRSFLLTAFARRGLKIRKVLKKFNNYLLLDVENLKFMDMQALISPHASYSNWLKSLQIANADKSFFPFLWFDSLDKLKESHLPDRTLWTNELKNKKLSDDEWHEIQSVWGVEGMTSMADFLQYYNNKDVSHFVDGIHKQRGFWKEQGICMITEGLSLSGLALKLFNNSLPPDAYIALPQKGDYNFIRLLRKSVCGGLSQVFHRIHVAGVTKIRNGPHLCRSVQGYDFNSLYLTELGMNMPFGVPFEWVPNLNAKKELVFRRRCVLPQSVSLRELEWLSYESWRRNKRIKHYLSCKRQFTVGDSKYRADGFLPGSLGLIFEFQGYSYIVHKLEDSVNNSVHVLFCDFLGCFYHGHSFEYPTCPSSRVPQTEKQLFSRWMRTKEKIDYLRKLGFVVIEMTSCEWEKRRKSDPDVKRYLETRFYPFGHRGLGNTLTYNGMLKCIREERVFGLVQVDIETPNELREKFHDMQPLILNRMVHRSDLGSLMESYCLKHDMMNQPRRILGQAFSAKNMLLITPLLNWYLRNGLKVTRLHWVRQFSPHRYFKPLVDRVIGYRVAADSDPSLKLQGESMKLAGNSIYGKTLENASNFSDIKILREDGFKRAIEKPNFRSGDAVSDEFYEVESARLQTSEEKPLIIGFFILQYSKLRMLRFYYDFLDRFLPKNKWQPILMDTDSLYLALAAEEMDDLVSDQALKQQYNLVKNQFMAVRPEQKRTPGLMKLEYKGQGVIALAPKTYYCFSRTSADNKRISDKNSAKGVQKANNRLNETHYYKVLKTQQSHSTTNKGLWFKQGKFVKYKQEKSGLPYLITKKKTEADGITLSPLPEPEDGVDAILNHSESESEVEEKDDLMDEDDYSDFD